MALYLETIHVQGNVKDMEKKMIQTLPFANVYSNSGDRTRITFMYKLISHGGGQKEPKKVYGKENMDQNVNTIGFNTPHRTHSPL